MIITQLQGGTGNQLFQYALGFYLAQKHKTDLKLDISPYANSNGVKRNKDGSETSKAAANKFLAKFNSAKKRFYSPFFPQIYGAETIRTYRLENFEITASPLSPIDLVGINLNKNKYRVVREQKDFVFDPSVLDAPDNSYISGFWQTEKYFREIAPQIRQQFTVKHQPSKENEALLEIINSHNAVAVHVRRGDYLVGVHQEFHGSCSPEYYNKAIELIKSKVENPYFFLFSDDPDWAKENIKTGCPTEVSYNPVDKEYEDLRLMYSCKHFIIANSTFSWWGAWLSANPDKIVVAPATWIVASEFDTSDVIPAEWTKISG